MFDQSFSVENYLSIFHEENRKGHIAFDDMPEPYRDIVVKMKMMKSKVNEITKKKKKQLSMHPQNHFAMKTESLLSLQ